MSNFQCPLNTEPSTFSLFQQSDLATSRLLSDWLRLERETRLASRSRARLSLHSGLDLTGHGKEGLLDIIRGLGRSLEEFNAEAVRKLLPLLRGHDTFRGKIGLVSDQEFVHIFTSISVNFVEPLFYVVEGLVVSDVVNDDDSVCAAVVGGCDCAESLLSGCVPDLEFDGLSV